MNKVVINQETVKFYEHIMSSFNLTKLTEIFNAANLLRATLLPMKFNSGEIHHVFKSLFKSDLNLEFNFDLENVKFLDFNTFKMLYNQHLKNSDEKVVVIEITAPKQSDTQKPTVKKAVKKPKNSVMKDALVKATVTEETVADETTAALAAALASAE